MVRATSAVFTFVVVSFFSAQSWAQERAEDAAAVTQRPRSSPVAADPTTLLMTRLREQDRKLDEMQQSLAALTRLLTKAHGLEVSSAGLRQGEPGFRPLYTINRDGTDLKFLLAAPGMITTGTPQWSHDGQAIVIDSLPKVDAVQLSRLWVYGVAGPFKGMLRDLGSGNTPTWSPDDSQIAYMVNSNNPDGAQPGFWTMNADGSGRKRLGQGWYTRWSPNGKEICVHAYFTNPPSLHIYNVATGDVRSVLGGQFEVMFGGATWSPGGDRLITLIRRDGEQHLVTIDADGDPDSIRIIYRETNPNRNLVGPPAMSRDGRQIVFGIQDLDQPDSNSRLWMNTYLYLVAADRQSSPQLLEGKKIGKINRSMEWSPDSQRIIFNSER